VTSSSDWTFAEVGFRPTAICNRSAGPAAKPIEMARAAGTCFSGIAGPIGELRKSVSIVEMAQAGHRGVGRAEGESDEKAGQQERRKRNARK
jgi:hypothetical protein